MKAKLGRPRDKSAQVAAVISVRIQPRASKNGISRMEDGSLKIRLTAPPVDGAANEALAKFLSDVLGVSTSQVEIVSGHTGRQKIIRVSGISQESADELLNSGGK